MNSNRGLARPIESSRVGPLATSRVVLACGQNLSNSGAAMYDRLRGSALRSISSGGPVSSSRVPSTQAGRSAGWGFLLAGALGALLACSSDDSAPQTGLGGSGGDEVIGRADAGRSPGEGFEATPDFDITSPQRPVPPRRELVEAVAGLNGMGGSGSGTGRTPDAGADAGADANL